MIKLMTIIMIEMINPYVLMISQNPMFHTPFLMTRILKAGAFSEALPEVIGRSFPIIAEKEKDCRPFG